MSQYLRSIVIMTIFLLLFTFTYTIEATTDKKQATIDVNVINVRSGPGMEHTTIGTLNKNSVHSILEEKDRWYKVPFNNKEGWIAGWLVSVKEPTPNEALPTVKVVESKIASLNVRTGPSTSFPVISTIKPSEYYSLLEDSGEWLKIQLNSHNVGWISKNLVHISDKSMEVASNSKSVSVTATILNVRSEPSTNSVILAKLLSGDQVKLLEVVDGWYKIAFDSTTGWIASEFAKEILVPNNSDSDIDVPIDTTNGNETNTEDNQKSTETTEAELTEVEIATVTVNILNVRAGPNSSQKLLGKLFLNETVEVIKKENDWLTISYNGGTGWIASSFVTIHKTKQTISQVPQVVIPKTGINIRVGPGTNYDIIKSANEGDSFAIVNTHGDWYEIKLSDSTNGFIANWVVQTIGIESADNNRSIAGLLKGKTIVVDAGHGGIDAGAIGSHFRTLEKDITLPTALLLESKLKAAGANVIMTRTTDRYLSLAQRVTISSNNKADAFISLHYNTNHNPTVNGTIVYHNSRNGNDAKLASIVQKEIVQRNGLTNLNARQGNFYVLRENSQLAILIEAAFISNYNDELVSRTKQFQEKVAEGTFQGIIKYFN